MDTAIGRDGVVSEPRVTDPLTTTTTTSDDTPELRRGTEVEVRRRFDRAWARGFVVEDHEPGGYRLRRTSDGAILPVAFPVTDVRPAPLT